MKSRNTDKPNRFRLLASPEPEISTGHQQHARHAMDGITMKEFVMVQRVKAKPMTRKEYLSLRGWITPDDENPSDEGFLIESEGKPNNPSYECYLQWLPKEQFESRYVACEDDGR